MVYKNIVFLSYGSESEYLRAVFCILTFAAWTSADEYAVDEEKIRIIVYTDNSAFFYNHFPDLPVDCYLLTPVLMDEMLGTTGFFHRRKVAVIDLTFEQFPDDDLLFIDTDTFFISDPAELLRASESGKSFMHKREYRLENGIRIFSAFNQDQYPTAFINFITGREFLIGGVPDSFSGDDYSWNSGVLGLHKDFAAYMPDVFKLTDEFYMNSKWFISEQLAFALILQRKTKVLPSDQYILHYWGQRQKALVDKLIADLFHNVATAELIKGERIRNLTQEWQLMISNDLILEKAVISLKQKYWLYGIKKGLQVILKDPLNGKLYKELFAAATSKINELT